jgi:hypothetical protein
MASIVRIKRSEVSGNPSTLAQGELAYSALIDNGSNGGDRLYIGMGTETNGNAVNHVVIGGKYFTDMLDHTKGTLAVSSALITDSNGKLNNIKIDNIDIDGNTISATDANGNVNLAPNGSGHVFLSGQSFPNITGTAGQYLKTDGAGVASWSTLPPSDFTLSGDTGSALFSTGSTLNFVGVDALDTAITTDTVTLSIRNATSTQKGAASFDSTDFTINSGAVSLNHEAIQDIVGGMVSTNTEAGITVSYDDTNGKLDFAVNSPTITISGDVDGSATMTNLGNTSISVVLDTVNSTVGTFGSTTNVPVVTVNAKGLVTNVATAAISTSFTLAADTGTPDVFNNGETLSFIGGEGIDTIISGVNNRITISAEDASASNKGVATFNAANFVVTAGDVTLKDAGVTNNKLVYSSVTIGSSTVALGSTITSLAGLTELQVDNININGNTIGATDTNGSVVLAPTGTGTVDVSNKRITGLAEPTADTDAATKLYVDTVSAQGLHVQDGVDAATTNTLAIISGGAVTYNNGASGVGATLTTTGSYVTGYPFDGVDLLGAGLGYGVARVLVKNQVNAAHNGIYILTSSTVLTRDPLFDSDSDVQGGDFVFVVGGGTYGSTGWVQTATVNVIGTDPLVWTQFSGAGTYNAGAGLDLTGTTFSTKLALNGGLEFSGANALQLHTGIAGNGLTLTAGTINAIGTADRITVGADAIDIASNYAGQTSITTLGTVTTGIWSANTIATTKGGTGLTSYSIGDIIYASGTNTLDKLTIGTSGKVLQVNGAGIPVWADLDGGTY